MNVDDDESEDIVEDGEEEEEVDGEESEQEEEGIRVVVFVLSLFLNARFDRLSLSNLSHEMILNWNFTFSSLLFYFSLCFIHRFLSFVGDGKEKEEGGKRLADDDRGFFLFCEISWCILFSFDPNDQFVSPAILDAIFLSFFLSFSLISSEIVDDDDAPASKRSKNGSGDDDEE